jgi:hypothetical protein
VAELGDPYWGVIKIFFCLTSFFHKKNLVIHSIYIHHNIYKFINMLKNLNTENQLGQYNTVYLEYSNLA